MHAETGMKRRGFPNVAMLALVLAGVGRICAAETVAQERYASPAQALAALREAVHAGDTNALQRILGPALAEVTNPDAIQRAAHLRSFAGHLDEYAECVTQSNGTAVLVVGSQHWPFPIPLVTTNGQWWFDTPAGKEEILNRRVGRNELSAIEVCHAYVQAQREYARKDRSGDGVMDYALRLRSTPGTQDGLYWDTTPDEPPSPLGPLVARAQAEGYYRQQAKTARVDDVTPFHGYLFRVLTKQGKHAPGGKYDYVINGHMVAGFALLAYPVEWGNSGVMTFIVNQQGKVFQKNLGKTTADLARRIDAYDPDDTWRTAE